MITFDLLPQADPIVSILIVNYNGRRYLSDCLGAIEAQVTIPFEIIIVDNASSDGSAQYIRENFPRVRLIRARENRGFAAGNNLAAKEARGRHLLLLNNDTVLRSDLGAAIDILDSQPRLGAIGYAMLGKDQEWRVSAGYFPAPFRLIFFSSLFNRSTIETYSSQTKTDAVQIVDWIEGSFILTPRQCWVSLQGMDEKYFMYVEDVDYCSRLLRIGKRTAYFPQGKFVHYGGYNSSRFSMLIKGYRRYHRKFSPWAIRFLANLILTLGLLTRISCYGALSILISGKLDDRTKNFYSALLESPW